MHQITLRTAESEIACTLPETWEECPVGTFAKLLPLWAAAGPYSRAVLSVLLRTDRGKRFPGNWLQDVPSEALGPLFDCLAWMPQPTVQPVQPSFTIKGRDYYFPATRMQNITLAEFAFVDLAWQLRAYQVQRGRTDAAKEWTARLCGYLLRPLDPRIDPTDAETYQGDRRERFNTAVIEERLDLFREHITSEMVEGVLLYVAGCKHHIRNSYQTLWPPSEQTAEELQAQIEKQRPEPKRWLTLARQMAGGKFGTYDQTMFTNLYLVLDELTTQRKEQKRKELQAQLQRAKARPPKYRGTYIKNLK